MTHRLPPIRRQPTRCRGISTPAAMLAVVAAMAVMGGLVVIDRSVRVDAADAHTQRTLRQLNRALAQYTRQHDAPPPGAGHNALQTLRRVPDIAPLLDELPMQQQPDGRWHITDGYGRPLRYHLPDQTRHGRAEFVSAGTDGRFGDIHADNPAPRRDASDNLHSSDMDTPRSD